MADHADDVTGLLAALRRGDASAMDRLIPIVYDDLRRRAHQQLSHGPRDGILSTTGLVHETYLKLAGQARASWEGRDHFFGVVVRAMRSVVVDYARRRTARKREGALSRIELEEGRLRVEANAVEILAIDQALGRLATLDARLAELVELRFFGGLSTEEAARRLGVSERTVKRDWRKARTLLFQLLNERVT